VGRMRYIRPRILLFNGEGAAVHKYARAIVAQLQKDGKCSVITMDHIPTELITHFDAVIFPGGSARTQSETIGRGGREKIIEFVKNGGGYLGICAGAYLGSSVGYGLSLLDIKPWSYRLWDRGEWLTGKVDVQISLDYRSTSNSTAKFSQNSLLHMLLAGVFSLGLVVCLQLPSIAFLSYLLLSFCLLVYIFKTIFMLVEAQSLRFTVTENHRVNFSNGALFDVPACKSVLVHPIGIITKGIGLKAQRNGMENKATIVAGDCGKGKVVLCGVHPEKDLPNLSKVLWNLLQGVIPTKLENRETKREGSHCTCCKCIPTSESVRKTQHEKRKAFRELVDAIEERWLDDRDAQPDSEPLTSALMMRMRTRWIQEALIKSK